MTLKKRKTKKRTKRKTKKIGGAVLDMLKAGASAKINEATSAAMSKIPNTGLALPQLKMATNAVANIANKAKQTNSLTGAIPAGLSGAIPAGLSGAIPPGLSGALSGAIPPGLSGAIPAGLSGAIPAGVFPPALTTGVNSLTGPLTKGILSDPKSALKEMPQFKMATNALSKSGLADKGSGLLSTLKIFKAYPMGTLLVKTIMKSYENVMLFKNILKSKTLRNNKYKKQINELTTDQKKDFDIACCLIKRFYIKDIANNYSYFRESDYITENCKVIKYIQSQIKLFNSISTKYQKNFTEVFTNNITKFANISNNVGSKTIDDMQQEIENAFTIGKNNYSYIILFLLHDIIKGKIILPANCDYIYKEEKCQLEETINAMLT